MKRKISITVNDDTLFELDASVLTGRFRNRSHAFEFALRRMLENG